MMNDKELPLRDKERLLELFNTTFRLFDVNHNLSNNYLTNELNLSTFKSKCILIGVLLDKRENYDLKGKLNHLLYSHGLKENYYYNPLLEIFKEIHIEQIDTENLFKVFFEKLENYIKTIRDIPLSEYILIFPINLNFKGGIPLQFLQKKNDIDVQLVPYSFFEKDYLELIKEYLRTKYGERRRVIPDYEQEIFDLIQKCNHRDTHFFIAKVHARNIAFAVRKVVDNIEVNAGLYNLVIYYRMGVVRFGGDPFEKSIGDINMPIIYIFNNGECKTIMFSTYELPRRTISINFNQLNDIIRLLSSIQQFKSEKLKTLLYDAFAKYYNALITSKYSVSFLMFWNILEKLLLKNGDTKLTEIIKRLKSTYPDSEENKKEIVDRIDRVYKKRNLFVHESIDKITRHDRRFVKSLVEHLIIFFIDFGNEFNNIGMLEFFYQNLRKPLNVLQRESQVLILLEDIKSRDSED